MSISTEVKGCLERASWIRKMFEQGAALRKIHGDDKVFDFTLGNPTVEPPEAFHKELRRLAENPLPGMHRYMSNDGYPETRAAVAKRLAEESGCPVEAGHLIMTCGAGGALNVALKTILNPGEEVLLLAPYFVEYRFYVANHQGTSTPVWTRKQDFQLDLGAIEAAIGQKTRALILNSPNNPTGVIYSEESVRQLGALIERKSLELGRQIYVISDEPYSRIAYDGQKVPSVFAHIRNSMVATSHSKDLALPGERIGYLAANPAMEDVKLFMEGAVFCNRVLGFVNAPALMQRLVARLQHESVDIRAYERKRDLFYDKLTSLGFRMVKPGGAFYLFPESPIPDDLEFANRALAHNILVVPGTGFGAPGYFRIAYCIEEESIRRSFGAWEKLSLELGMKG